MDELFQEKGEGSPSTQTGGAVNTKKDSVSAHWRKEGKE